jgi:hypothetical protein
MPSTVRTIRGCGYSLTSRSSTTIRTVHVHARCPSYRYFREDVAGTACEWPPSSHQHIDHRHHDHRQDRRCNHAADHRGGDAPHDFRPRAAAPHDGKETRDDHRDCHGNWTHSQCGTLDDGLNEFPLIVQPALKSVDSCRWSMRCRCAMSDLFLIDFIQDLRFQRDRLARNRRGSAVTPSCIHRRYTIADAGVRWSSTLTVCARATRSSGSSGKRVPPSE